MNRINPIHIFILIVVLFGFFTFKLNQTKEELRNIKNEYKKTLDVAIQIDAFKKSYKNKTQIKKKINKILKSHTLRKVNITKEIKNSKIILKSKEMDIASLNYLMGKVLNSTFIVSKLSIKKINNKKATFMMEIQW
ncbi:MAG: hypothetical protein ABGW74_09310 [Campylobacterales bacterium]